MDTVVLSYNRDQRKIKQIHYSMKLDEIILGRLMREIIKVMSYLMLKSWKASFINTVPHMLRLLILISCNNNYMD